MTALPAFEDGSLVLQCSSCCTEWLAHRRSLLANLRPIFPRDLSVPYAAPLDQCNGQCDWSDMLSPALHSPRFAAFGDLETSADYERPAPFEAGLFWSHPMSITTRDLARLASRPGTAGEHSSPPGQ